jgi:hypothetical protein
MEWMVAMITVTSPKQLPQTFRQFSGNAEDYLRSLLRKNPTLKLGDVYMFIKGNYVIQCVEVLP